MGLGWAKPFLFNPLWQGHTRSDIIQTLSGHGVFAELLFQLKLQNVSDSWLLKLEEQSPILSICNLSNSVSFPFSKGSHHQFRLSLSGAQAPANTLQFTIWSKCKRIMLDQLVSLRWQHLDVKWMDGVVKRRHRNICKSVLFAQLHSLFNDFIRHGSSELIHSDNVSRIFTGQESVANKQSILPCIRPNQKYSKYSGSASSDRRGCRYFSFSHSGLSLRVVHLEIRSALDTGERIRSRTHFISITTCTLTSQFLRLEI